MSRLHNNGFYDSLRRHGKCSGKPIRPSAYAQAVAGSAINSSIVSQVNKRQSRLHTVRVRGDALVSVVTVKRLGSAISRGSSTSARHCGFREEVLGVNWYGGGVIMTSGEFCASGLRM
jgi:hypothetical protein